MKAVTLTVHTWLLLLSRGLRYNRLGWWLRQLVLQVPKLLLILQVQWRLQILSHPWYTLTHVHQGMLQYLTRSSILANILKYICGNKMPTRCNRWFLLQVLLLAQHVSGTTMPIIRSSRVLYRWLLPVVFGTLVFKLLVLCGAEGCVSG